LGFGPGLSVTTYTRLTLRYIYFNKWIANYRDACSKSNFLTQITHASLIWPFSVHVDLEWPTRCHRCLFLALLANVAYAFHLHLLHLALNRQVIFHEYAVNSARRRGVHSFWENRGANDPSAVTVVLRKDMGELIRMFVSCAA